MPKFAVATTHPGNVDAARCLAQQLKLPFIDSLTDPAYDFLLVLTPDYLGIQDCQHKKFQPFYIDFNAGKLHHRSKLAGRRTELIAKAMGIKPGDKPVIIDATAGLGRDSFILASIGYHVTLLEKSLIVHALLANALTRMHPSSHLAKVATRMTLINANAVDWLKNLAANARPDIIYVDPMFPERQKSASVKKEMLLLQQLLPAEEQDDALFNQALACAVKRVVVKRPRLAGHLADKPPTYSLMGKSSRFDIYVV